MTMTRHRRHPVGNARDRGLLVVLAAACLAGPLTTAAAQPKPKPMPRAAAPVRSGAWALPDAESLINQAIARIVAQDRPAGLPIAQFHTRRFGRAATSDAVREFSGRSLAPHAFTPVDGWPDAPALDVEPCPAVGGIGCPSPSAMWLAVTRLERGERPHDLLLWYTTHFTVAPFTAGQPPQTQRYTFCERWHWVGNRWQYYGFVRVVPQEAVTPAPRAPAAVVAAQAKSRS